MLKGSQGRGHDDIPEEDEETEEEAMTPTPMNAQRMIGAPLGDEVSGKRGISTEEGGWIK